jgi:transcriptional regulator of acetoin/glycerol metabolism
MRLIAKEDLAAKLSLSVEWVEQAIPEGLVPSPIELDGHIRWSEEVIDMWIRDGCPDVKQQRKHLESDMSYDSNKTMKDFEKDALIYALEKTNGNREEAAKLLGIGERTLYRKIKKLDLDV